MAIYRNSLPQLTGRPFLTDGGLETTLIYKDGFELPEFASFILLDDEKGIEAMREYYRSYLSVSADLDCGFILETPTWRANRNWAAKLGYKGERLDDINRRSVTFIEELRNEFSGAVRDVVLSGNIGPRRRWI